MNEHTSLILDIAMKHPIWGTISAILLATSAYFIPCAIVDVPLPIMHWIQVGVWVLAGWASYLTIKGYYKKKTNS